jgi:integrase
VSIDDLRLVIDSWEAQTARTRQKVTSVIRAFWSWAEEQGHIALSPAARIRRPRAEHKVARVLPLDAHGRLLTATPEPRDRLGLFCLLELGLRRSELAGIQFRDFDADRGWLRVYGKGQKERVLPLRGPILAELRLALASDLPHLGRPPAGDDFLLYPVRRYADGKGTEGQLRAAYRAFPKTRPSVQAVHRWWYRHAQAAGLVGPGVTAGLNMHRARHTFAMELRRVAGIDAASHALGHSNLSTTLGIYGHRDNSDLERAMDAYNRMALNRTSKAFPPKHPEKCRYLSQKVETVGIEPTKGSPRASPNAPDAHGRRLYAALILLWQGALRCFEALALTENDLDESSGTIIIRHGKGDKTATIKMAAWAWPFLNEWRDIRTTLPDPTGTLICVIGPGHGAACATAGEPLATTQMRSMVRAIARTAGVKRRCAPHQLRHAWAVQAYTAGVPLRAIQLHLRHENIGITDTYLQGLGVGVAHDQVYQQSVPLIPATELLTAMAGGRR